MLTKTNIFSVQNYLRGNIDLWQFANDKQNVDVTPPWKNGKKKAGKSSADAHDDRAFSLSFFRYFRASPHYELLVSFRSLIVSVAK